MSRGPHHHNVAINFNGQTGDAGAHTHTFSGSGGIPADAPAVTGNSAAASNVPRYVEVVLCQKN